MKKERLRAKELKKYLWITGTILVILVTGGIFAVREIMYAQFTGAEETAQMVLDKTVLSKIESVDPFTGGMQGFLFSGLDEAGNAVYVWTEQEKVVAMQYADRGLTREAAIEKAKRPVWAEDKFLVRPAMKEQPLQPMLEVVRALPGPVLPTARTEFRLAESKYVWEIYGQFAGGIYGYTYLDFRSGDVLWQITLPEPKQIEEP